MLKSTHIAILWWKFNFVEYGNKDIVINCIFCHPRTVKWALSLAYRKPRPVQRGWYLWGFLTAMLCLGTKVSIATWLILHYKVSLAGNTNKQPFLYVSQNSEISYQKSYYHPLSLSIPGKRIKCQFQLVLGLSRLLLNNVMFAPNNLGAEYFGLLHQPNSLQNRQQVNKRLCPHASSVDHPARWLLRLSVRII